MFVENLTKEFVLNADKSKQIKMEAYMKNHFSFFGIASPERKIIQKNSFTKQNFSHYNDLSLVVKNLWSKNQREYQYTAIDLMIHNKNLWNDNIVNLILDLIVRKSWWDSVDLLASNLLFQATNKLSKDFGEITKLLNAKNNLWCSRASIILQLKRADKLDKTLLSQTIKRHKSNNDFFIQKAIGWSLRQASRRFPNWVIQEVELQAIQGLAKKESLKLLN